MAIFEIDITKRLLNVAKVTEQGVQVSEASLPNGKHKLLLEVEDTAGQPIRGLYAAGELVGGIFYHNYPGGTGLTSGAVFGKLAGTSAATGLKK